MVYQLYKLEFLNNVHFGKNSLNDAEISFSADTLFSALCIEALKSGELKKLYEIMRNTDGIYGGRFSGAGFKGCCMALVDPEKVEDIKVKVTEEYLKAFPELWMRYLPIICPDQM